MVGIHSSRSGSYYYVNKYNDIGKNNKTNEQ